MPIIYDETAKRCIYNEPSNDEVYKQIKSINLLFTDFVNRCYKNERIEVSIDYNAVYDLIIHVDKRNTHSKIFHIIEKPNEYRIIALYCYWLVRLHPFTITTDDNKLVSDINESFAVYLYTCIIKSLYGESIMIDLNYIRELKYTLRYRELNKATLILLLEPKIGIK